MILEINAVFYNNNTLYWNIYIFCWVAWWIFTTSNHFTMMTTFNLFFFFPVPYHFSEMLYLVMLKSLKIQGKVRSNSTQFSPLLGMAMLWELSVSWMLHAFTGWRLNLLNEHEGSASPRQQKTVIRTGNYSVWQNWICNMQGSGRKEAIHWRSAINLIHFRREVSLVTWPWQ